MSVPRRVYWLFAVGLVAVSQSANIVRLGRASAIAIVAWRLLLAVAILTPFMARSPGWRLFSLRQAALLGLAGVMLALHLITWVAGVQATTVASAMLVFSIHPVLTSLGAFLLLGERTSLRLVISIVLGVGGVVLASLPDWDSTSHRLVGDAWVIVSALLFSAYVLLGRALRPSIAAGVYVTGLYIAGAIVGTLALLVSDAPLFAYDARTWTCFVLMALLPTLAGHSTFNYALRYIEASRIAVAMLIEPVLASVVALVVWHEPASGWAAAGYLLIVVSVVLLFAPRSSSAA